MTATTEINYRELLMKYMELVVDVEGTVFLKEAEYSDKFNALEFSELVELSRISEDALWVP
jgi:hypothetical protein